MASNRVAEAAEAGDLSVQTVIRGHVLVVDDDPLATRAYARQLAAAGYDVAVANHSRAAERLMQNEAFDVIVSDVALPEIDGLMLLASVRERDEDLPVILLTNAPALESAVRALDYGAFRYLVKPVATKVLEDTVGLAARAHGVSRARRQALAVSQANQRAGVDRVGLDKRFASALQSMWVAQQPIVSWSQRRIFAHEALVRNDEATLRNPLDLFDAAERLGRLNELGRAIRVEIARALQTTPPPGHMFVNLHPADLADGALYEESAPLRRFADQVVFEITERATLDSIPDLPARMARLRTLGYRIALDDLGAGYSGLSSFTQLEPDVVKVDMSLIRGIEGSAMKQRLVGSVVSLCSELGILIIGEGIETAGERDALVGLGGDLCQGYLFARPGRGYPEAVY
ncbi:MAG TPA: EAL domain-containing protein [Polyangia bacterium]|jgi:EAL domain-containing protein (putative c-di-GMP-specific phosphodiesterase class I)|nr:EAL domain-containing protein [Polyangia bacterium]